MIAFFKDWFGWPNGAVLTNLVASLFWAIPGYRKLHAIHRSHKELHRKFEASLPESASKSSTSPETPQSS